MNLLEFISIWIGSIIWMYGLAAITIWIPAWLFRKYSVGSKIDYLYTKRKNILRIFWITIVLLYIFMVVIVYL